MSVATVQTTDWVVPREMSLWAWSTVKSVKEIIYREDWANTVQSAKQHPSLKHIICSNLTASSWCHTWDLAFDKRRYGTKLAQCLSHCSIWPLVFVGTLTVIITFSPTLLFWHLCQLHVNFGASNMTLLENSQDIFSLASQIQNLSSPLNTDAQILPCAYLISCDHPVCIVTVLIACLTHVNTLHSK